MIVLALQTFKYDGEWVNPDDQVTVEDVIAETLIEDGVAVEYEKSVEDLSEDVVTVEIPEDLNDLKVDELKELCKKLGLSEDGLKQDLIDTIELELDEA